VLWFSEGSYVILRLIGCTFFLIFLIIHLPVEDGESDEQVVLVSRSGTINRIKVRAISIQSRFARGVILMRLEHAGKIQSASLISAADPEPVDELTDASLPVEGIEAEEPAILSEVS